MFQKDEMVIDKQDIQLNRLPLLHKDQNWISIFGNIKDKEIKKYLDEVISLENEEKELTQVLEKLENDKRQSMNMILKISDSINTDKKKENIKLLDEHKEMLLNLNDKIDEVLFRIELIPEKIRETNFQLLNATIKKGYENLSKKEEELSKVVDELDEVNERMKELVEKKIRNESWIDGIYTFMHRLLGNDIIDDLDRKAFK